MKHHKLPTHPGIWLWAEWIEPLDIDLGTLAEGSRIPREMIDALLAGRQDFTAELAARCEWMLGLDDGALMEMQKAYDTARAQHQSRFKSAPELAIELDACLERKTNADFLLSLRAAVRQIGMTPVAHDAGISRPLLYRVLTEHGNPRLKTLAAILRPLGLRLGVVPISRD